MSWSSRVKFCQFVAWNIHTFGFLPILFHLSCCSVCVYAISVVVSWLSSFWCIHDVFNFARFSYSFFSWHISSSFLIIMSCGQHRYPWPSLATSPYHSSPLAGLQGYIPYPHRAAVYMFELAILLLLGHMWGSIGVHYLWANPCFSSSVLHVWFVWLG